MTIALVYFTFDKDYDLLKLSIESINRLKAQGWNIDIYVANDSKHPVRKDLESAIYIDTDFDRKGNLRGIECIKGMISVFEYVNKQSDYDWICKIDSDVVLNKLDQLAQTNCVDIAQFGFRNYTFPDKCICLGAFRGYSKLGIENLKNNVDKIPEMIQDLFYLKNRSADDIQKMDIPEDHVICKLACLNNPDLNAFIEIKYNNPYLQEEPTAAYCDFKLDFPTDTYIPNINVKKLVNYQCVFFKQMIAQADEKTVKKADVSRCITIPRMKQYIEFLKESLL